MLRLAAVVAAFAVAVGFGATVAVADPITCPPGSTPDPRSGQCLIVITGPGEPGGGGSGGSPGGSASTSTRTCTYTLGGKSRMVPCSGAAGWWSQSEQAYCRAASPQPPHEDPAWGGRTDGQIYECTRSVDPRLVGVVYLVWLAQPPNGAPPDPRVLARQAIATMDLRAVSIGIVPEDRPGRVGVVGMPVWMWDTDRGASTWGPVTKSVAAGGYSVTATGRVSKVVWAMGDGQVVVCRTPGTPYADAYGKASSPDCGYRYDRQGRYTVRATSYWSVDWTGIGQSGSIPLQFSDTAVITVGEVQVLTQ